MEKVVEALIDTLPMATIGALFITARSIMYENYRSAKSIAVALFVALPTSIIAGGVVLEMGYGTYFALAVAAITALLSEHIFIYLVENPEKIIKALKDKITK